MSNCGNLANAWSSSSATFSRAPMLAACDSWRFRTPATTFDAPIFFAL